MIHSDGWRGYDGLVDIGYDSHYRVNHGQDEFAILTVLNPFAGLLSLMGFQKEVLSAFERN